MMFMNFATLLKILYSVFFFLLLFIDPSVSVSFSFFFTKKDQNWFFTPYILDVSNDNDE